MNAEPPSRETASALPCMRPTVRRFHAEAVANGGSDEGLLTQNRRCTKLRRRHRSSLCEPTAAQPRGFFQRSAASNSQSRSIGALRLAGGSGSGFSDARNLSPISRTMVPTVYVVNVNSVAHDGASGSAARRALPPQPIGVLLAIFNRTGDRRFWLSARALVLRTAGRWPRPLAIPRHAPCYSRRATVSCSLMRIEGSVLPQAGFTESAALDLRGRSRHGAPDREIVGGRHLAPAPQENRDVVRAPQAHSQA